MGIVNGTCEYARIRGKALICNNKNHLNDICFFQYYCMGKQQPLNTENYKRCPIRTGEYKKE